MYFRAHTFSMCSSAASNKRSQLRNTVNVKNEPGRRHPQITLHVEKDVNAMTLQQSTWPQSLWHKQVVGHGHTCTTPWVSSSEQADPLTFMFCCEATPGILCWQYLRITIGLLFIAFVVVHVESHLTDLTMETSFMPILEKKKFKSLVQCQCFPGWVQKGVYFWCTAVTTLIWKTLQRNDCR